VVDRQHAAEGPIYLVLDPLVADPDDPETQARFEHSVSEIATAVVGRLRRDAPVGLVVGSTVIAPVRSARQSGRLLRPLAEVELTSMAADGPADLGRAPVATLARTTGR
jgi:hypothetical protein